MTNIVHFPNKPKKPIKGSESMEKELRTLQRALNRRFDEINKHQEGILKAEREIDKLQTTYDRILKQYAEKVGHVTEEFLDYGTIELH